jgi:hypothetical protein
MTYSLTALCPLRADLPHQPSGAAALREQLSKLPRHEASPFALVPSLFTCRLFVLDDVCLQGQLGQHVRAVQRVNDDHLSSKYLVFAADVHLAAKSKPSTFAEELWANAQTAVWDIWQHCLGFERVTNATELTRYFEQCRVHSSLAFAGVADTSLAEQLKALYLKQELALFAREHQGKDALTLQRAFQEFVRRVQPFEPQPSWRRGASQLDLAITNHID